VFGSHIPRANALGVLYPQTSRNIFISYESPVLTINNALTSVISHVHCSARSDDGRHDVDDDTSVYEQFVVRILPVPDFITRQASETKPSDDQLNVLVLALSGVAHGEEGDWERHLPRTSRFLKDQLHGVRLSGFNLFGDSVSSNIVPMLTGKY